MKIAFVGAGGVGKTELLHSMKSEYKNGTGAVFVPEAARQFFRENDIPEQERFAFNAQSQIQWLALENEQRARDRNPRLIFCDRSVLDAPVYVSTTGDLYGGKRLLQRVRPWLTTYSKIYLLDPKDMAHTTDEIRFEDAAQRDKLHAEFLGFFALHEISYELLQGSIVERTNQVKQEIYYTLGITASGHD